MNFQFFRRSHRLRRKTAVRHVLPLLGLLLTSLALNSRAADGFVVLNDDGGWSWFEDERAIVHAGKLIVGSVANGAHDTNRVGDIDVSVLDLRSREIKRSVLHKRLQPDDHNSPALLARPDGRIVAMYAKHHPENRIYYRITTRPGDATDWQEERVFVPSEKSRITYSNLHSLADENDGKGRLYNFFRGYDDTFKPSWMTSDDGGETWRVGGLLLDFPHKGKQRPYVKYASDGTRTIHFAFTEAHPRNFDNSIFHAFYRDGWFHRSDGSRIHALTNGPATPALSTEVFAGDSNNVAWIHDIALDGAGLPRIAYSVQKDSAGLPSGKAGEDHRYRFARWDGARWTDCEIAYAGRRLYVGEDDYTGGIALHPDDPGTVFISTNVDPVSGKAGSSGHYEIFRGSTRDGGATWEWTPVTKDSGVDNLRPIVPKWERGKTALVWLRGTYTTYTRYKLSVVADIKH